MTAFSLSGCPNPNQIGVQQFGSISAHCVQKTGNQPVSNALVNANSTQYCYTNPSGDCTIEKVPIGQWTVSANAAGLQGSNVTTVTENQTSRVTIELAPSNG